MKKIILSLILLATVLHGVLADDTIRVMQYNLLYYGKQTSFCTNSNNNIDTKNQNLKTIIEYIKPDIFGVNELDGDGSYPITDDAQYLLDNALNVNGVNYYRKTETQSAYLANIIFYNSNKLVLKSSQPISFTISGNDKVFNAYKFYYNADDLEITNDTAFLYCVVAHLKAGNETLDLTQRTYETGLIMDYFESIGEAGNYLVMGDFNVYTPTEECFQNFINPDNSLYTFYDPADQIGEWSANYNYRYHHTQSTHVSGECYSSGGMDDRFDFILASDYIMKGLDHYTYIPDSYKAVGQDGSKYNQALNITSNGIVPVSVAQALYTMSDHLPVYLELKIDQNPGEPVFINKIDESIEFKMNNPVKDLIHMSIQSDNVRKVNYQIISIHGKIVHSGQINISMGANYQDINISELESGIYVIRLMENNKPVYSGKIIKERAGE